MVPQEVGWGEQHPKRCRDCPQASLLPRRPPAARHLLCPLHPPVLKSGTWLFPLLTAPLWPVNAAINERAGEAAGAGGRSAKLRTGTGRGPHGGLGAIRGGIGQPAAPSAVSVNGDESETMSSQGERGETVDKRHVWQGGEVGGQHQPGVPVAAGSGQLVKWLEGTRGRGCSQSGVTLGEGQRVRCVSLGTRL